MYICSTYKKRNEKGGLPNVTAGPSKTSHLWRCWDHTRSEHCRLCCWRSHDVIATFKCRLQACWSLSCYHRLLRDPQGNMKKNMTKVTQNMANSRYGSPGPQNNQTSCLAYVLALTLTFNPFSYHSWQKHEHDYTLVIPQKIEKNVVTIYSQ